MNRHNFDNHICRKCNVCFCYICLDILLKQFNLKTKDPVYTRIQELKQMEIEYINLLFPCSLTDDEYIIKNIIE